jgi:hypothetical protein
MNNSPSALFTQGFPSVNVPFERVWVRATVVLKIALHCFIYIRFKGLLERNCQLIWHILRLGVFTLVKEVGEKFN